MNVHLTTGKYEIVETGSVIIPSDDYIQFAFEGLRFRFLFNSSVDVPDKTKTEVVGTIKEDDEGKYLEIEVKNYNDMFASPMHKLHVGKVQGNELYVDFSIVSLTSNGDTVTNRIMLYSWYKER